MLTEVSGSGLGSAANAPRMRMESELCSRFRCSKSNCAACASVCPVAGAVRFGAQGAEITATCVGCGACASACPNGALQPIESDRQLAERIQRKVRPGAVFRIACPRADGIVDLVVPCLGRLSEAVVLEALRGGAQGVELLDSDCSSCGLRKTAPQWQRTLALAQSLCECAGLGTDRVVRVAVAQGSARETPDLSQPQNPRRALFRSLAAKWKETETALAGPDGDADVVPAPFRELVQRHHANPKRSDLLDVLAALPGAKADSTAVPAKAAPLAVLEIDRRCVGCNVCETLCPVGALHHRESGGEYALEFEPALCTGCRVCEAACFHQAIHVKDTVDLAVLFERRSVTLIAAARQTCRACGEGFLDAAAELCPSCLVSDSRRNAIARRFFSLGGK